MTDGPREVTRWDMQLCGNTPAMLTQLDGQFVEYTDYAKLEAERDEAVGIAKWWMEKFGNFMCCCDPKDQNDGCVKCRTRNLLARIDKEVKDD